MTMHAKRTGTPRTSGTYGLGLLLLLFTTAGLGGCHTGDYWASETSFHPAHVDDPVPPPVSPGGRPLPVPQRRTSYACPPAPRTTPVGEVYAGASVVAGPAWGPAIQFGQVFRRTGFANWSFELDAAWQDLSDEIGGKVEGGDFAQARGGVKAELNPCGRGHPTLRAGFGWFRTTGETDWVGNAGDYIAFHAGVGYEFDITRHLTTGPEITALFAAQEKGFDLQVLPQARWHVIWKF